VTQHGFRQLRNTAMRVGARMIPDSADRVERILQRDPEETLAATRGLCVR
jgi:hypothetical protein